MDESPGKMYALTTVMLVLATVPVGLRYYTRMTQKQPLMADDWLMIPALVGAYGTAAAIYAATALGGLGEHTPIGPDGVPEFSEQMSIYLQANFVTLLTQVVTFGCMKLSVLFLYRRLFRGKIFNYSSWFMIGVVIVWTISFFFAQLLQCLPVSANWLGPEDAYDSYCINENMMYIAGAWSDVAIDAIILAFPIPIIWSLQMTTQRKVAVIGIFFLGALTILSSVARLIVYYYVEDAFNNGDMDLAWIIAPTFYWPMIESALGILSTCLPTLRPLFSGMTKGSFVKSLRSLMSIKSITHSVTSTFSSSSSSASRRYKISSPIPQEVSYMKSPCATLVGDDVGASISKNEKDDLASYRESDSFGYHAEIIATPEKVRDMV